MKRIIALFGAILLTVSLFGITAAAAVETVSNDLIGGGAIEYTEDYSEVTYGGITYKAVNSKMVNGVEGMADEVSAKLSEKQQETMYEILLWNSANGELLEVTYNFMDGTYMCKTYLQEAYMEAYMEAYSKGISGEYEDVFIDFEWPYGNIVTAKKAEITQNKTNIFLNELDVFSEFRVYAQITPKDVGVIKGQLIVTDSRCYYVDFEENGINYYNNYYIAGTYNRVSAYEITDKALKADIEAAVDSYYGEEFGYFYDDNVSRGVSKVLLFILLGILPFVILAVCAVLAIRLKGRYRKLFLSVGAIALLEIAVYTLVKLLFKGI